jgi:hypothetical protein
MNMGRSLVVFLVMACASLFIDSRPVRAAATCVEVSNSVVGTSAMRKSTRSNCDKDAAQREARGAAADHVLEALGPICNSRIRNATARQICANAGMAFIGDLAIRTVGDTDGMASRPAPGRGAIALSLAVVPGAQVCVALRDLPAQSSSTATGDPGCFFSFKKTTVVWRMRGHCGVICIPR